MNLKKLCLSAVLKRHRNPSSFPTGRSRPHGRSDTGPSPVPACRSEISRITSRAPHEGLLIIARLGGSIEASTDLVAFGGEQKELGLDPGFDVHALCGGFMQSAGATRCAGLGRQSRPP